MIREVDKDENGTVEFEEFLAVSRLHSVTLLVTECASTACQMVFSLRTTPKVETFCHFFIVLFLISAMAPKM